MIADRALRSTLAPEKVAEDEAAIRGVMASYNDALNGGKTPAVMPLYADDGVFMPPYSESALGKAAVERAYNAVFDELKFRVKFTIAELIVMAPTWAYVRTNSAGATDHHSTGKTTAEANQELFIFKKGDDGQWRIARYSFFADQSPIPMTEGASDGNPFAFIVNAGDRS
ncbi:MAG: SgcJ/EcaC family oxidoreductase [Roseiarcus sp.]|uniref:YybH family protein n=1 Tax=Roseiarcus sp. TaxID=1969460 RepID=UPI003C5B656E